MKLKEIIEFLDEKIPPETALDFDEVGFKKDYDLNQEISSIKIYMDLLADDDTNPSNTLIITHHPPLFIPETPTYTIHSNWDIVDGGANEALAETLNLKVNDYFDTATKIGRICNSAYNYSQLIDVIYDNFKNPRFVNKSRDKINRIAVISGFGLKNPEYVRLAKDKNIDVLISGDLTQETAILAKNLNISLIDLGHHESEVPGLYKLKEVIEEINIDCEVIDKNPIEK